MREASFEEGRVVPSRSRVRVNSVMPSLQLMCSPRVESCADCEPSVQSSFCCPEMIKMWTCGVGSMEYLKTLTVANNPLMVVAALVTAAEVSC